MEVMIMGEEVIHSKEMRLRLSQLEYKDLSTEEFQSELERIYLEENGERLPADVEVFPSSQADLTNDDSGYEGTAVHFYSEDNNIDEVYRSEERRVGRE